MRQTACALMVMALAPFAVVAQRGPGRMTGQVIAAGAGRANVAVQLVDQTSTIVDIAFTDASGRFLLTRVPSENPGGLFLTVEEDGFLPVRERLNLRQLTGLHTIYLVPQPDSDAAAPHGGLLVDVSALAARIPDDARQAYARAVDDVERGRTDDAVERLERLVESVPEYHDAWITLGVQYLDGGRFDDAEGAFEAARQANPGGALAPLNLGILRYQRAENLQDEGSVDAALAAFDASRALLEDAVRLDPASTRAVSYLGMALYRIGAYDAAESRLVQALGMPSPGTNVRLMLINVHVRQNRLPDALDQAAAFLEENPDAPERGAIEDVQRQIRAALGQ